MCLYIEVTLLYNTVFDLGVSVTDVSVTLFYKKHLNVWFLYKM